LTDVAYLYAQSKNIIIKSFLLQGIISGNKYTKHMERELAAQETGEYVEDFDEEQAKKEFVRECKVLLVRNTWNLILRKFYERIAVHTFDLRLADRLTKDVFKSNLRKLGAARGFSPNEASRRVFYTGLYSGVVPALALFTVDCGYGLYDLSLKQQLLGQERVCSWIVRGVRWTVRRMGLHTCVALCSAGGVALGARLNWAPQYSTLLIAALCEAIGGELYNITLGSFISAV
jgi:hypothetical protein